MATIKVGMIIRKDNCTGDIKVMEFGNDIKTLRNRAKVLKEKSVSHESCSQFCYYFKTKTLEY